MSLEEKVVALLQEKEYTITTAESCTGGLVAATIINVSGASDVYNEGYITYANEAKERILGVAHNTLETFGAVSEQTAKEMALGAAKAACSNVALSTTGIAGPGGGNDQKPVGLVYIGCAVNGRVEVREYRFEGNRQEIRNAAVNKALQFLLDNLSKL